MVGPGSCPFFALPNGFACKDHVQQEQQDLGENVGARLMVRAENEQQGTMGGPPSLREGVRCNERIRLGYKSARAAYQKIMKYTKVRTVPLMIATIAWFSWHSLRGLGLTRRAAKPE